jgi:GT2 family glycosyltransferase
MRYLIKELDLLQPIPALSIPSGYTGYALVVRWKRRIIGFILQECRFALLNSEQISLAISRELGAKILEEMMAEELGLRAKQLPLPSLTIAICTHNRSSDLQRCLSTLLAAVKTDALVTETIEVLVIDNAPSNEDTREVVARYPGVRYALEKRQGLDFARNCAIARAHGALIAFIDDDVVVDRAWLSGLRETFNENPDAAGFTGLVLPYSLETSAQCLFERRGGFRRGFLKRQFGAELAGNLLYPCGAGIFGAGCNMAFRRDVLLSLGGFDDALDTGSPLAGGGDLDMFYRCIRAGHTLAYEPQCLVFHQHRREFSGLRKQYWSWGSGFMAFIAKSYQTDRNLRPKLRRTVVWWFGYRLCSLKRDANLGAIALFMGLVELCGGIAGLMGAYARSQRRVQRIKQAVAS